MTTQNGTAGGHSLHLDLLNAWSADNPNSDIPRMQYGDENSAAQSDRFLVSASYLTLQNVNMGYTLPQKWVKTLGLSSVRIYAAGSNLYYWSVRKGFDPRGSFTGNADNTINVLNGEIDEASGWIKVQTGANSVRVRNGLLIDPSRSYFDYASKQVYYYTKGTRGSNEGYEYYTWE